MIAAPPPPVAIVTGAASGIGRHFAQSLLARGYRLVAADIDGEALRTAFGADDDQRLLRPLDVSRAAGWQALIDDVLTRFGRIDYLFNIAGTITPGYVHETPVDLIDRHLDVNAKGVMYGTRLAAEVMVRQSAGHIINIASLAGVAPIAGIALYSASKFAVRGFSLAAAYDLRRYGVYVSVVCPDLVATPMLTRQLNYEEAAMTFSGPERPLSVDDVTRALFRVMRSRAVEVTLPPSRGWLAKLGNLAPGAGFALTERLRQKGLRYLRRQKKKT